jgi:hypothetical protein
MRDGTRICTGVLAALGGGAFLAAETAIFALLLGYYTVWVVGR